MRRIATRFIAWIVASRSAGAIPATRSAIDWTVTPAPSRAFPRYRATSLLITRLVRNWNLHLFAETASTKNARINSVNVVCCSNEEDLVPRLQSADLDERLFDQLHIMLIHVAAESWKQPVHFIKEDDGRSIVFRSLKDL